MGTRTVHLFTPALNRGSGGGAAALKTTMDVGLADVFDVTLTELKFHQYYQEEEAQDAGRAYLHNFDELPHIVSVAFSNWNSPGAQYSNYTHVSRDGHYSHPAGAFDSQYAVGHPYYSTLCAASAISMVKNSYGGVEGYASYVMKPMFHFGVFHLPTNWEVEVNIFDFHGRALKNIPCIEYTFQLN